MNRLIESVQIAVRQKRGVSRAFAALQLTVVFTISAFQRAIALLFQSPQKSFAVFHKQMGDGVWDGSYLEHRQLKKRARLLSWSSMTVLVLASVLSYASTELLFPNATQNATAVTSTFTVTTNTDSGAGSLRQAILDCNSVSLGNDCLIQLNNSGVTQTLTLATALPNLSKPAVFSNLGSDTDLIIDGGSLGSGSCWALANGSNGSIIEGVAFYNCPDNGITIANTVSGVQIGNTASAADRVYFAGGTKGLFVNGDSVTVQNATFGSLPSGTVGSFSENAIFVSSLASGFTLTNATIAHATSDAVSLDSASSVTLSDNTISNNTAHGIEIQSVATATVSGNTIQSNGSCGVNLTSGSDQTYTNNTIASNTGAGVCVAGSPSNVRIGASSAGAVGSAGNSITGAGSSAAIAMGTATPSGFAVGYNALLYNASSYNSVTYTTNPAPVQEVSGLAATTTEITGTASVSSGIVAAYQNGSFIGATSLSGTSFSITGSDLAGALIEGAVIQVVTMDASNNPSPMITTATVANPPAGISMSVVANPASDSAEFTASSGSTAVRLKVYVATTAGGLASDTPDSGSYGTSHDVTVSGLAPETLYYWKVLVDAQDGSFTDYEVDSGTFTTDAAAASGGGSIAVTPSINPSETGAVFTFTSTVALTPKVYVSRTQPDVLSATPVTGTSGTSHTVTVDGLTANTTYYYAITGTAADASFTDSSLATGSFTTDATTTNLDDDFLSENATVNDQVVYDPAKKLYLGPDAVNLELENTTKDSDVSFEVKEKTTDDVVLSVPWQEITKQVITETFKNLEQGVEYIINGTLRKTSDPIKQDSEKKVATVQKTDRKAPAFTTYSGGVTVTAVPTVKMGGDLKGLAGEVILQDIVSGKTVASCDIPKGNETCTLAPYPAPGDYRIQFRSVKNNVPSAPDQTLFTITKSTPTSVLVVDRASGAFMNRIVTNNTVKLVGNAAKSADVEIYLNGKKIKTLDRKKDKDVAWDYTLSLKNEKRKAHVLRVIYRDRDSEKFVKTFTMPFVYSSGVVDVVLQGLQTQYTPGADKELQVLGGRGDVVSAYIDGAFVRNIELEQVGETLTGKGVLDIPRNEVGSHTVELRVRNSVGLAGKVVKKTYSVVRPQPIAVTTTAPVVAETPSDTNTNTNTDIVDVPVDTNSNTNESTTNTNTVSNTNTVVENANTNESSSNVNSDNTAQVQTPEIQSAVSITALPQAAQDLLEGDLTTAGLIIIDESVSAGIANIPAEYARIETDPVKKAAIAQELQKAFETKPSIQLATKTSAGTKTSEGTTTTDAVPVFTQSHSVGLPGFGKQSGGESHGIELSGVTRPYALVKVTVRSTPIVKMTRADENGKWTMTVPADALESGKHTASLQTESQGVVSENVEIANFVIVDNQKISNTTWVVIVNLILAFVILLFVLGVQLGRKKGRSIVVHTQAFTHSAPDQHVSDTKKSDTHSALDV